MPYKPSKPYETRKQKVWRLLKKYHYLWVPLVIIYLDRIFILWPYYSLFGEIPFFMKLALLETFGHTIWFTFHLGVLLLMLLGWLWVVLIHIAVAYYICRVLNRLLKEMSYRRAMEQKALLTIHREIAKEQVHKYFREIYQQTRQEKFLIKDWPRYFLVQVVPKEEVKNLTGELPTHDADFAKLAATPEEFDKYLMMFYCAIRKVKEVYIDRVWGKSGPPEAVSGQPSAGVAGPPPRAGEETTSGKGVNVPAILPPVAQAKPVDAAPAGLTEDKPAAAATERVHEVAGPGLGDPVSRSDQSHRTESAEMKQVVPQPVVEAALAEPEPAHQEQVVLPEPEDQPAAPEAVRSDQEIEPAKPVAEPAGGQPAVAAEPPDPAEVALARVKEMAVSGQEVKPMMGARISLESALKRIEAKIESKNMIRREMKKPPLTEVEVEQIRQEYLSQVDPEELAAWRAGQGKSGGEETGAGQVGQAEKSEPAGPMAAVQEAAGRCSDGEESGLVSVGREDREDDKPDDEEPDDFDDDGLDDSEDDEDEPVTPEQWAEALRQAGGNPLVAAVICLMSNRNEWQGSPSELLVMLGINVPRKIREDDNWPQNVRWLTRKLNQSLQQLSRIGFKLDITRTKQNRSITISKK